MAFKLISAWDAKTRTKLSMKNKSVEPALQKIHAAILEAADGELMCVDISRFVSQFTHTMLELINRELTDAGYTIDGKLIRWNAANPPRSYNSLDK